VETGGIQLQIRVEHNLFIFHPFSSFPPPGLVLIPGEFFLPLCTINGWEREVGCGWCQLVAGKTLDME